MYLKSSSPVLDDDNTPTKILGWDIVFTGQRIDTLEEFSMTGTITLNTPLDFSVPVTRDILMGYVDSFVSNEGWEQAIIERIG